MLQKQRTKAQKRRQHQAEREAGRAAELEAERAEQGESEKSIEDRELKEMLTPLGLTVRFIQVWQLSFLSLLLATLSSLLLGSSSQDRMKLRAATQAEAKARRHIWAGFLCQCQ